MVTIPTTAMTLTITAEFLTDDKTFYLKKTQKFFSTLRKQGARERIRSAPISVDMLMTCVWLHECRLSADFRDFSHKGLTFLSL